MVERVLIPGYPGPSPACRTGKTNGIEWGVDVYANENAYTIDLVVWEKNLDGTYSYINQDRGKGLIWSQNMQTHPLGGSQNGYKWGPDDPGILGTFPETVAYETQVGMIAKQVPVIQATINWRCDPSSLNVTTEHRLPDEVLAQQEVAWGVYGINTDKETWPVALSWTKKGP